MVHRRGHRQHRPRDDLAVDDDRRRRDLAHEREERHAVQRRERPVGVVDPERPHRADHRAPECLPRQPVPLQVDVPVGREPRAEPQDRPEQPRRRGVENALARPELGVVAGANPRGTARELVRDLDHVLAIRVHDLHTREVLASLGRDDEEDVDRLPRDELSADEPRVELGVLGQRVRQRLADQVRHGDPRSRDAAGILDERQKGARVDLEVAVDLRIVGVPPRRRRDLAPAASLHRRPPTGPRSMPGTTSRVHASGRTIVAATTPARKPPTWAKNAMPTTPPGWLSA